MYKKTEEVMEIMGIVTHSSTALNPLSANLTKWSNTLKQFVGCYPTSCLSVFGHFVGLALKGLNVGSWEKKIDKGKNIGRFFMNL